MLDEMQIPGRKKKRIELLLIAVMLLAACAYFGYKGWGTAAQIADEQIRLEAVNKQINAESVRSVDIDRRIAYLQTDLYIEEVARRYLGLVYPEEIIIKPR